MSAGRRTAALLGLGLLLSACTASGDGGGTTAAAPTTWSAPLRACPEQPDRPAAGAATLPPVALRCPGGGTLDLGRAPGTPTVVNLWASWCGPCREELPLVQDLADLAGDRLSVVGVISKDGVPQADSFAADAGATFPSAYDRDGALMDELGIQALPFTYLVDADGALVHTQVGPVASVDELRALVAEHLGVQL
ncbi:Thiol-disulfide isomerase or thioredoxin [Geodermatophilus dictyosporus]|uniref:Thiol-disulfide isomerase or thioredoxin n=1 Tax=Geodermatophilus dictyosporus TaxID=1523247 RepID=A0A1I5N3U6_9ACTN|nr:TlpA disulfide reductase family protein [Geodermatophilus dictyosporus]SFP16404.1 Thiol-disulfide isomerase or thioredoxin [Geodermatophilus dictyosporus]